MSAEPTDAMDLVALEGIVEPLRAVPGGLPGSVTDPVVEELRDRLRSLDDNCLRGLQHGLAAMLAGDHTYVADPVTEPIAGQSADPNVRALVDIFNSMLQRSQEALTAYDALRRTLADALGDRSCLPELRVSLQSLEQHCLTDLDHGLQAVVDGDLRHEAHPVTRPLVAPPDRRLGELGESFNQMLARSRTALYSYDTMREDLRGALGDRSCLEALRAKLYSLHRHCLRDLDEGLEAVATGTQLTRQVAPVTTPLLPAEEGEDIGELAEVFNRMLARTQSTLAHYDELRSRTRGSAG